MTTQPIIRITLTTDPDARIKLGSPGNHPGTFAGGVCPCPEGTHKTPGDYDAVHAPDGVVGSFESDVSLADPVPGVSPGEIIAALDVTIHSPAMLASIERAYAHYYAARADQN